MQNLNDKSSKKTLEDISKHCFTYMVPCKHSKDLDRGSNRYKEGKITTYEWINNLSYYYLKEEENLKEEFILNLKSMSSEVTTLKEGDYKKGIIDTLNEVLEKVK